MFSVTKPAPNRVDIDISGSLDAEAMRDGLDALLDASEEVSNGRMLYNISSISLPTLGALGVEFARLPKLFGLLSKFEKCAVLADAAWLRQAAEIEGALFPGIEIKSFDFDQEDAAEDWLARAAT